MKRTSKYMYSVFIVMALLSVGCKKDDNGSGSSVTNPDRPTPGKVDATGGFNVKVNPPEGADYYIHRKGDFDKKCVIDPAATSPADRDIDCVVEAEELELKYHGLEMVLNVPPSMCRYYTYTPYWYFGRDFGFGATSFTINFDKDGNFHSGSAAINGTPGTSGVANSSIKTDGTPSCNFNYTNGPSCCMGSYIVTTIRNYLSADPELPQTAPVQEEFEWGGLPGNCLAGAGADMEREPEYGLPYTQIEFSPTGKSKTVTLKGTIANGGYHSWYHSNYVTSAFPATFKTSYMSGYFSSPYYYFQCFDDALEQIASIRVQVREWNEMKEFVLLSSGNPDTTGSETYWGGSINDYKDWDDQITLGDTFPGMPDD